MSLSPRVLTASAVILLAAVAAGNLSVLDESGHHLRSGETREWVSFPEKAEGDSVTISFDGEVNPGAWTLLLRQRDVKQGWRVQLNGKMLGRLTANEDDLLAHFTIPANTLKAGKNELVISATGQRTDDIEISDVRIDRRPPERVLADGTVQVEVRDDRGRPLPCRLTVVDEKGSLAPVGAKSDGHLAVRTGVVYTSDGKAEFGLRRGKYRLYAGRGFEYSLARFELEISPGETVRKQLTLKREVPTPGLISCDTHIHTLTYSGHGDATIDERMITIAGEGIELAVATDHNVHVDYEPFAQKTETRRYFTPVIGNEVTTKVGHFNAFPIATTKTPVPNYKVDNWQNLVPAIRRTPEVSVVILNHPRNVHSGFQPTGPKLFNAASGELASGWSLKGVDGMEVVTSAALQSDLHLLYRDWFALLNRGQKLVPIGSSDSHDVNRYILGQGRTYLAYPQDDDAPIDPARIDVEAACQSIKQGRVSVSMGLLVRLKVNERFVPGDALTATGDLDVACEVYGPSWITADTLSLYANGVAVASFPIQQQGPAPLKFSVTKKIPRPKHDVHLVAIASGPGPTAGYWRTAKPYQAASPVWNPRVIGSTGAIWVDADADGKHRSPRAYAERLVERAGKDLPRLLKLLNGYDEAVAIQAASLWHQAGNDLFAESVETALKQAPAAAQRGFAAYQKAVRDSELARRTPGK